MHSRDDSLAIGLADALKLSFTADRDSTSNRKGGQCETLRLAVHPVRRWRWAMSTVCDGRCPTGYVQLLLALECVCRDATLRARPFFSTGLPLLNLTLIVAGPYLIRHDSSTVALARARTAAWWLSDADGEKEMLPSCEWSLSFASLRQIALTVMFMLNRATSFRDPTAASMLGLSYNRLTLARHQQRNQLGASLNQA